MQICRRGGEEVQVQILVCRGAKVHMEQWCRCRGAEVQRCRGAEVQRCRGAELHMQWCRCRAAMVNGAEEQRC